MKSIPKETFKSKLLSVPSYLLTFIKKITMKKISTILSVTAIALICIVNSCTKENKTSIAEDNIVKAAVGEKADIFIDSDGRFEKVITKRLVKPDDCRFITEGAIEFRKGDRVLAVIDYGNGECDDIATKTVNGSSVRFSLKRLNGKWSYFMVVEEPLVKIANCDYIVSGVVAFYSLKNKAWLASINFGDGTCDEWATKITKNGRRQFSLDDWHWK